MASCCLLEVVIGPVRQRHSRAARGLDGREHVEVLAEAPGVGGKDGDGDEARIEAAEKGQDEVEGRDEDQQDAVPLLEEGRVLAFAVGGGAPPPPALAAAEASCGGAGRVE